MIPQFKIGDFVFKAINDPAYGWTDDPKKQDVERIMEFWDFGDARPIICIAPPSGDMLGLFESGSKFHIIEMIGGEIYRIDDSTAAVKVKGLDALRLVNFIDETVNTSGSSGSVHVVSIASSAGSLVQSTAGHHYPKGKLHELGPYCMRRIRGRLKQYQIVD